MLLRDKFYKEFCNVLNIVAAVQECDATMFNSSNAVLAPNKKTFPSFSNFQIS